MAQEQENRIFNVLWLCTGNSARSIMAEAYTNFIGHRRFKAYSAGAHPAGTVNPYALEVLAHARLPAEGLRSKSWNEFAGEDAPHMDFVITVCDQAAGEPCPVWPGQPMNAHWSFEDPAAFVGTEAERRAKFHEVFRQIRRRIDIFTQLPIQSLDSLALKRKMDEIGEMKP